MVLPAFSQHYAKKFPIVCSLTIKTLISVAIIVFVIQWAESSAPDNQSPTMCALVQSGINTVLRLHMQDNPDPYRNEQCSCRIHTVIYNNHSGNYRLSKTKGFVVYLTYLILPYTVPSARHLSNFSVQCDTSLILCTLCGTWRCSMRAISASFNSSVADDQFNLWPTVVQSPTPTKRLQIGYFPALLEGH